MAQNLYALILAGGSGERFWPLSRRSRPKQLLSLFCQETLLEATLARVSGLVPPERTFILTNRDQETAVRALAPHLPATNVVAEPAKRDTAAAIALGAGLISRQDRRAAMVVLPADQIVRDVTGFQRTIRTAATAAEQTDDLVTIGVRPSWPCPSFGYIEQGKQVRIGGLDECSPEVFEVVGFREKPNPELAESFLRKGGFRWNAGMFVWTIQAILGALDRHVPELAQFIALLHQTNDIATVIATRFPSLPKASIDYAVMEKASRVLEVEAAFDWDDVGSWTAAAKYWDQDSAGNAANGALTAIDAAKNVVYADPGVHVALMGVNNLIVVHTKDAVLVCNRRDAEKIKRIVANLPPEMQ